MKYKLHARALRGKWNQDDFSKLYTNRRRILKIQDTLINVGLDTCFWQTQRDHLNLWTGFVSACKRALHSGKTDISPPGPKPPDKASPADRPLPESRPVRWDKIPSQNSRYVVSFNSCQKSPGVCMTSSMPIAWVLALFSVHGSLLPAFNSRSWVWIWV